MKILASLTAKIRFDNYSW